MNELYPLKFVPVFKEKIWGGKGLRDVLGYNTGDISNCGEAWLISGVEGNVSVVSEGFLAGNSLDELIEVYMADLVGDDVFEKFGNQLPLLVKIIDTTQYLSVQVHPDDAMAKRHRLPNGKNEMWYIMEAGSGSKIINGFVNDTTSGIFRKHLENKDLQSLLNYVDVEGGDAFYIPAGRIHAIGPGIMLAEIQQSSDTTYRVYDWDRIDAEGNPRELHTALAMEAIEYNKTTQPGILYKAELNKTVPLMESPYFSTSLLNFSSGMQKDYSAIDSFIIQLCTAGQCILMMDNYKIDLKRGEAALIPAMAEKIQLIPDRSCTLLEACIA